MAAAANAEVDPRRSPSPNHGGALYLDCETTGLGADDAITCVAITDSNNETVTWHSGHAETLTPEIGGLVVDFIVAAVKAGNKLFTFNGAAFD